MTQEVLNAYKPFIDTVWRYVHIKNDRDYENALELLEELMESATDDTDEPLNPLIDLLSTAIGHYEATDDDLVRFLQEAEDYPKDIAMLRTLMEQHHLTGSDLPEIGSRSMVSLVLNGKRELTRSAIEKLCARFNVKPAMFF